MAKNQKSVGYVRGWQRGQAITAERLDNMVRNINANTRGLSGPKQQAAKEESDAEAGLTDLVFTEISRSETTVTLTDSNGDTVNVNQIDQVIMENASGDLLQLNFTN